MKEVNEQLNKLRLDAEEKLRGEKTAANWLSLAEVTMACLIIFNGKRGNEVAEMLLKDLNQTRDEKHNMVEREDAHYKQMDKKLKKIAKKTISVEVRGKCNQKVPVLIGKSIDASLVLMEETREECGVLDINPFVFCKPGDPKKSLESSSTLHKFRAKGFNIPHTRLVRHYIATSAVGTEISAEQLSGHLGHTQEVHHRFYRSASNL